MTARPHDCGSIRDAALALIRDPARHTTAANAVDADGNNCAGATDEAVAWSVYGAVGRVTVRDFNTLAHMDEWRATTMGLRALGAKHSTPHAEALRMLADPAAFREGDR
jgi:hypothetical protein